MSAVEGDNTLYDGNGREWGLFIADNRCVRHHELYYRGYMLFDEFEARTNDARTDMLTTDQTNGGVDVD